ncbi:MAG: SDR family oxidoreductase [Deltaproteobacteria bacterium]|nr:SDR family oxidoreductase [Deltaproteobacteria bacterium]
MNHENKWIFVSGAASRTGHAIARHLIEQKAHVVANFHHHRKGIDDLIEVFGKDRVVAVKGDVSSERDVRFMVDQVKKYTDRLDGLINVVGSYLERQTLEISLTEWRSILANNLDSVFLMCQNFYPLLKQSRNARVINFAYSAADRVAASKCQPYHIAKMGVISLSKTLAKEWGKDQISVNVISPGTLFNSVIKTSEDPKDYIPQERFGRYEDLWPILDMIFREDSTYLTGNNFHLSGGYNL